jgi:5'/3'-nucleotidase
MSKIKLFENKRILLTNDDGYAAPGIQALERIIRPHCPNSWVVAPETEQSGAGHSLTLRHPLRIHEVKDKHYAVDGTPTDCVLAGVNQVMKDAKPDFVLSGINRGRNIADHITYSGTVAAALEATLLGIKSIAFSMQIAHYLDEVSWEIPEHFLVDVLNYIQPFDWPEGILLNVNFPSCKISEVQGIRAVRQGRRKLGNVLTEKMDLIGRPYYWMELSQPHDIKGENTDIAALNQNYITITPLNTNLTHLPSLEALANDR